MQEIWKDISGYEGYYQVSNSGRIKSLERIDYTNHKIKEKILNYHIVGGYSQICLCKNGISKEFKNHRLVLMTFIGNSNLECNHKDGNKLNNNLDNLEWINRGGNIRHALKLGLKAKGQEMPNTILKNSQVHRIKWIAKYCKPERGYWVKMARSLKINPKIIINIIHNRSWKHIEI